MIESGKTYLVMGLLDSESIAYSIGQTIASFGGKVIYTVQSERMKKIFFDRSKALTDEEKASLDIRFCEVTEEQQVIDLFASTGPLAGVVHSIAYANPKTCLGDEFHTNAFDDLKNSFHISAVSLATVVQHAQPVMTDGGGVVALTFESELAFAYYNWMGVNKAALEATVRALARRHGRDAIRVNAVSSGPVATRAAKSIPSFKFLAHTWNDASPIPWDVYADRQEAANAAVFLLGQYSKKITGQVLRVDGGSTITGGSLLPRERPEGWVEPTYE